MGDLNLSESSISLRALSRVRSAEPLLQFSMAAIRMQKLIRTKVGCLSDFELFMLKVLCNYLPSSCKDGLPLARPW